MFKKMKYFSGALTLEQAKSLFRSLCMEHHPDKGGDEEIFKEINAEWEYFLAHSMASAFSEAGDTKTGDNRAQDFADILKDVMQFNCTIEIIGFWIYCFNSFAYKDQLKAMGFWFSMKHKAWIYSGDAKRKIRTGYTLADNRAKWGSEKVREQASLA